MEFQGKGPASLSVLGALVSIGVAAWNAYTAWDASTFRQPFEERKEVADSFHQQIRSAESRKDFAAAERVRIDYENYEEGWRAGRQVLRIVAPVEGLRKSEVSDAEKVVLKEMLFISAREPRSELNLPSRTLGAAYLAIGDYEKAVNYLDAPTDPRSLALQSAAFTGLAVQAQNEATKERFESLAAESFRAALSTPSSDNAELTGFAESNASLQAILVAKGIQLRGGKGTGNTAVNLKRPVSPDSGS